MKQTEENGKNSGHDYYKAIQSVVHHLKSKRNELEREISCDEEQRAELLGEKTKLEDRLSIIDANLKKKSDFRKEYDKAIAQTEGHFAELVEKSENFLTMTRREVLALSQAVSCSSDQGQQQQPKQQDYNGRRNGVMNGVMNGAMNGAMNGTFNGACNGTSNGTQTSSFDTCIPQPPAAVLAFSPVENQENCVNCTKVTPCTTIMIPFRANGL